MKFFKVRLLASSAPLPHTRLIKLHLLSSLLWLAFYMVMNNLEGKFSWLRLLCKCKHHCFIIVVCVFCLHLFLYYLLLHIFVTCLQVYLFIILMLCRVKAKHQDIEFFLFLTIFSKFFFFVKFCSILFATYLSL